MSSVEERVRAERAAQGLPTPAAPIGDDEVDARVAAAYRNTATVLTSAMTSPPHGSAAVAGGEAIGAAGGSGELTRNASADSTPTSRRAPVAAGTLQDNAG